MQVAGPGEPCPDGQCGRGLQCGGRDGTCYRPGGFGDACQVFDEFNDSCQWQLHCAGGTCRADFPVGRDCTSFRECQSQCCDVQNGAGVCCGEDPAPLGYCDPNQFTGR